MKKNEKIAIITSPRNIFGQAGERKKRVVVAMSGGIDSSVAAAL